MAHYFCLMWKNALIMRMWMLAKYPVPYCWILSDPLSRGKRKVMITIVILCVQMDACKTKCVHFFWKFMSLRQDMQVDGSLIVYWPLWSADLLAGTKKNCCDRWHFSPVLVWRLAFSRVSTVPPGREWHLKLVPKYFIVVKQVRVVSLYQG